MINSDEHEGKGAVYSEQFDVVQADEQKIITSGFLDVVTKPLTIAERTEHCYSFATTLLRFSSGSPQADVVAHCLLQSDRVHHHMLPPGYTIEWQGDANKNSRLANSKYITARRCLAPAYSRDASELFSRIDFPFVLSREYHTDDLYQVMMRCGPLECFGSSEALVLLCALLFRKADGWRSLS